jgi:hypothetical protein
MISPYLFFWQASLEVQEQEAAPGENPLKEAPKQAPAQLGRMREDTYQWHVPTSSPSS